MTTRTRDLAHLYDRHALNKSLVGFDQLFDAIETRLSNQNNNYPPYNVIKLDESNYLIELAVAGFRKEEIRIEILHDVLSVQGKRVREEDTDRQFLHRGLSARDFDRTFQLAEHIVIKNAMLKDGILTVYLERQVPEEKKPKLIDIVEL